ncbi:YihY/virulence factor BrkB family protein [Carbonactinospora thermoautotrophica]|uniref:YihY/virulence factor BrkB family protein n=1 Tax=Carbonactinospora thermoautotrophica TaxID=1469144 RepID=UPI00226F550A|nr:YhjD/YihY/BrkB family envelope integrity protein [Carbonactinospora thermoautotrophica]
MAKGKASWLLVRRTVLAAWEHRVLGLAAEAGFWGLLSLPPLLLTLLSLIGYVTDALSPLQVDALEEAMLEIASGLLVPSVVTSVVHPLVHQMLTQGRSDVASLAFVGSLWAGSTATHTYVNTIAIAYGKRDARSAVRSRLLALALYLGGVVVSAVLLPLLVVGPRVLGHLLPARVATVVHSPVGYWAVVLPGCAVVITTLYRMTVPGRSRWWSHLPGGVLAAVGWAVGSLGLRWYVRFAFAHANIYGPLAAPAAALLFLYVTALAVLVGAELNAQLARQPRAEAAPTRAVALALPRR